MRFYLMLIASLLVALKRFLALWNFDLVASGRNTHIYHEPRQMLEMIHTFP